ncbi:MAG: DUF1566 domain-containing protein [Kiritimatiellia bacterium]
MKPSLIAAVWLAATPAARAVTNTLQSVVPSSAQQGTTSLVVTFTLAATPPAPGATVGVKSVTLGTVAGTNLSRPTTTTVTGTFNIPGGETPGPKDVTVTYQGSYLGYKAAGFTVTPAPLAAGFTASPTNGVPPLAVGFTDASTGTVSGRLWDFGDGATSTETNPAHTYNAVGTYTVRLTVSGPTATNTLTRANCITVAQPPANGAYPVVDTGQTVCYNNTSVISPPAAGQPFYGQDAQIAGHAPSYRDNGDGTVSDLVTGLMWVRARGSKASWAAARDGAAACRVGGYDDWRFPTIKELYSLILFSGANGQGFTSTAGYVPFINTNVFGFAYGSGVGDERVIDCQDWSATQYVSTTMNGDITIFGVNFADGRIKGYPRYAPGSGNTVEQTMYFRYVRGNTGYGVNRLVNNGDGTISDKGTLLMWTRDDGGTGMNWESALAWVQARNAANHLGHNDWRLPNAKELQSILDYTRSPATTASAAIDRMFNCTPITNEAGAADFPFYWSGTTLLDGTPDGSGVYLCFGRAMGYMNSAWLDVHGAGAQRSDFKAGDPAAYPTGRGPQGDAVRITNHVRLVRDIPVTPAWRFAFVGDTHTPLTTIPAEIAAAAVNDDIRFLIVAGDLVESGAGASPATLQSQLTAWREAMAPVTSRGVGLYVLLGNHEDDVPNGQSTWDAFFSGVHAMPGNGPDGETGRTYSFACENALFVGLDDYAQIHRVNQAWLNQQLAANTRPHVFVFGHEPAFKAFHTDCLDDYPDERNAFWDSLAASGARVYLCGHDHFLNVARIDDGDGNPADDLTQWIVGTGGTTNWPNRVYNYNGDNAPYTPVNMHSVTNTYGYLLVEVSGPGGADRGVTLTWKQRTYDAATASYLYVATPRTQSYTAPDHNRDSVGDGIPDVWRRLNFGGDGTTTNAISCATCDPDHDGADNLQEFLAATNPTNDLSRLAVSIATNGTAASVAFPTSVNRTYALQARTNLVDGIWGEVPGLTGLPGTGGTMVLEPSAPAPPRGFFRVEARSP